ncbi:MAG: hypothetical protein OXE05_04055 [Chloroflexi bacterium]|nr:hypothetical protein [Chloroflexota bacterium]
MQECIDIIVALANPQLRTRLVDALQTQDKTAHTPRDLPDLLKLLVNWEEDEPQLPRVLVLDEAFIYPHVYEECVRIKALSRLSLTVVLLVEPRTRTRSDWMGVDRILRLPMRVEEIVENAVRVLESQH